MPAYDPDIRTRTLARVVGPYLAIMAVALIVRQGSLFLLLPAFMQDGPLVLATGAFTLMAGLVMLAAHHHWRGAAAIVISAIAVITTLKGAMLMIAPLAGAALSAAVARTPLVLTLIAAAVFIIGLWLAFIGWAPARNARTS
ncbi:MAG: hypothetical protein AB7O04_13560 [Hyphomonadaceae bacterium]